MYKYCISRIDLRTLTGNQPQSFRYIDLIKTVPDRPGHDRRYSIDSDKLQKELNWEPKMKLRDGLQLTITEYIKGYDK